MSVDKASVTSKAVSFPDVTEQNVYSAEVAQQRNLLLLGKSGCGKTTLFEVLKSSTYVTPPNQTLFAGQRLHPEYTPLVVRNQVGKAYSLNVIDTPGLFEVRSSEKEKRSNDEIFKAIEECIRENSTKLSAIFILIPATSVLNEEDLEMLRLVKHFLGDSFKKNTMLIFTKADMFKLETLKVKVQEFLDSSISHPFLEFCQGGVYFSGSTCGELVSEYGETYEQKTHEKVACLRQYLIDVIMATEDKKLPANFGIGYVGSPTSTTTTTTTTAMSASPTDSVASSSPPPEPNTRPILKKVDSKRGKSESKGADEDHHKTKKKG